MRSRLKQRDFANKSMKINKKMFQLGLMNLKEKFKDKQDAFSSFFKLISFSRHVAGFTLIEMLVVVAIIGILSSVLLTSLGPSKEKAKDARIIQEINQARTIAELLNDGDYDALPTRPDDIQRHSSLGPLITDIRLQGGELTIKRTTNAFMIYSKLNSKSEQGGNIQVSYYCVDSLGRTAFTTDEIKLFDRNKFSCP